MTERDRFFDAWFPLVKYAKAFEARIREPGWYIVPGSITRIGKVVTWEWDGRPAGADGRSIHLMDMLETVGFYGSEPTGRKARLNGITAPASY